MLWCIAILALAKLYRKNSKLRAFIDRLISRLGIRGLRDWSQNADIPVYATDITPDGAGICFEYPDGEDALISMYSGSGTAVTLPLREYRSQTKRKPPFCHE
jgi:hypothetical protein